MAKRDEFRLDITANDQASGKIDEVAGKLEGLNAAATVSIDAEDNATETIEEVTQEVEELDGATAEAELSADDEASEVVGDVTEAVEELDGETAEATLAADDEASGVIGEVAGAVEGLDGATAEATITVDDSDADVGGILGDLETIDGATADATVTVDDSDAEGIGDIVSDLDSIDGEVVEATVTVDDSGADNIDTLATDLESIDGETFEATVEVDDSGADSVDTIASDLEGIDGTAFEGSLDVTGAAEASEATGEIVGNLSGLLGPGGLAALATLALGGIAGNAAQQALDIQALATATGGSLEELSRLAEVWELAGGTKDNLERSIARAWNKLSESPALVDELGIHMTDNMGPFDVFVEAIHKLNDGQFTTNERLSLATELFGSKGVLILNDLQTRVGDLDEGMAAISDNEIITADDVANALVFTNSMDSVQDSMGAVARDLLPTIAHALEGVVPLIDGIAGALDFVLPDIDTTQLQSELAELFGSREGTEFIDELIDAWQRLKDDLADNGEIDTAGDELQYFIDQSGASEEQVLALAGAQEEGGEAAAAATALIEAEVDAEAAAAQAAADHQAAIDDEIASLEAQRDALEESSDALSDQADAYQTLADTAIKLDDAERDARQTLDEYNGVLEEHGEASLEAAAAGDAVRDSAIKYADALVANAQAARESQGATLSATEAIDIQNNSLAAQASTLRGPARAALLAHIQTLNGIPDDVMTQIDLALQHGDIVEAQRLIASVSGRRKLTVQAEIDSGKVAAIEGTIDYLTRSRTVHVYTVGHESTGRIGGYATGTPYAAQGLRWVGEQGPELVEFNGGERVVNDRQSDEMANGWGGGGNTYITTLNVPSGTTARDALKATRRYGRTQAA